MNSLLVRLYTPGNIHAGGIVIKTGAKVADLYTGRDGARDPTLALWASAGRTFHAGDAVRVLDLDPA